MLRPSREGSRYTFMVSSLSRPIHIASSLNQRVPGIDLLRGLCIVAVVVHHINLRVRLDRTSLGALLGTTTNRALFWSGYNGVIVFFVISGFLITTWSIKRWDHLGRISRRQFYLMRFARIVPCLLGLLAILSVLDKLGVPRFVIDTHRSSLPRALLAALTFHINWLEAHTGYLPASWDVLWSLSIEEVFYLFFPLICTLLRKQALIIGFLCCFLVIGPWSRVHTQNQYWAENGYLSCMDGIALGCLAAIAATRLRLTKRAHLSLGIAGALLCIFIDVFRRTAFQTGLYKVGLDTTILELGTALLLIALQLRFETQAGREHSANASPHIEGSVWRQLLFRSTGWLRWFGRNSYETYLTHMFVIWPIVFLFQRSGLSINAAPGMFLITTALAGLLGWLVARFYSEPLNHWLRYKLAPRKASSGKMAVGGTT
jgi:peptidoglycan/LPS O-acetylase OafA/YrhL